MTMFCSNCLHSHRFAMEAKLLQCRRYPPTVFKSSAKIVYSNFPSVLPSDFCGEWTDPEPEDLSLPPEVAAELDQELSETAKLKWAEEEAAILSDLHAERAKP